MELPDSYFIYDKSAIIAQSKHFKLIICELIQLVIVAVLSLIISLLHKEPIPTIGFSAIVIIFFIGIIIQLHYNKKQFERKWFEFRAVAESIKSLAWQYAAGCGNFCEENNAEMLFLQQIKQIKETYKVNPDPKITSSGILDEKKQSMEKIRKMKWEEKREAYIKERIDDQITWYTDKAKLNKKYSTIYENIIIGLQFIVIFVGIVLVYTHVNGAPVLALVVTLITGIIGWSRSKQYAELVDPYQNAARELNEIRQEIELVEEELSFQRLVLNAEQAISREHTMWLVNRGLYNHWHKLE
ncbi:DUF4231 domain-containing protein [Methanococcoides sp. FTZ1]|uniref:DUF4231 domain-containing protein n=1 Tax=Methanococcoides sp. FTZ1 TaxID=3439061 RepID=UPI003F849AB2